MAAKRGETERCAKRGAVMPLGLKCIEQGYRKCGHGSGCDVLQETKLDNSEKDPVLVNHTATVPGKNLCDNNMCNEPWEHNPCHVWARQARKSFNLQTFTLIENRMQTQTILLPTPEGDLSMTI